MNECRRLKRRHLIYYLRVFNRETDQLLGHLVDITEEGLMLISEHPIEMGITFQMRMLLPSNIGGMESWEFDAISRWCRKDINPDFFDSGFQLNDTDVKDLTVIRNLIRGFGFQD